MFPINKQRRKNTALTSYRIFTTFLGGVGGGGWGEGRLFDAGCLLILLALRVGALLSHVLIRDGRSIEVGVFNSSGVQGGRLLEVGVYSRLALIRGWRL